MPSKDPRVDAYIAAAPPFARPILKHLRAVVHAGCPDVVETIKWRMPAFDHKGPLAGMGAFKQHVAFGFWKHDLIVQDDGKAKDAMGSFGCIKQLSDLPSKAALVRCVREATRLNDEGVKVPRGTSRPKKALALHPEFQAALAKNGKARKTLDGFPPSARAEYVEWIADAKQDATRARRIAQAVQWLAEGKRRHWKYERR